jgi:hypothetical protein
VNILCEPFQRQRVAESFSLRQIVGSTAYGEKLEALVPWLFAIVNGVRDDARPVQKNSRLRPVDGKVLCQLPY